MRILTIDTGSFMIPDIRLKLGEMGYGYNNLNYIFDRNDRDSKYHNEELEAILSKELKLGYDCVLTTNFYPIIARICYENGVRYLSWSYDSPMNLTGIEEMDHPTNYIFIFDKSDAERYKKLGLEHIYYLPLAVNCDRLDGIAPDTGYDTDVSFLGQLYDSTLPALKKIMAPYHQEFVDKLVQTQLGIYGNWFVDDMLTDRIIDDMNKHFRSLSAEAIQITRDELAYSIAQQITYIERITLLRLISGSGLQVDLYTNRLSDGNRSLLSGVKVHDGLSYGIEMPALFKTSRINLNPTLKIIKSGIPLRALDIMGCGGFLLTNFQPEIAEYFKDGEEVVMYKSMEEAVAKAKYYLKHEEERLQIIRRGYEKVRKNFNYVGRISEMLKTAGLIS